MYQMRKLKNKGAIIVLVWNFFTVSVSSYLQDFLVPHIFEEATIALGLTLPFAGWLADIHFGRYKVIRWSMWIMWITSMLITVNSVTEQFVPGRHNTFKLTSQILAFILTIGLGGYHANIIQFGLDQLQDASTTEITAFITWYVWTYYCNGTLFQFTYICIKKEYYILGQLIISMSITVVLCSFYFLEGSLVMEPVTQNPFILIYKVIRYAIKNKHPRYRSAFTYCEDELPSRMDFGKSKYGGPFTTEQVEDVKTFLRLLIMIVIAGILGGQIMVLLIVTNTMNKRFLHTTISMVKCYTETLYITAFGGNIIAVFIPLHEFILYPISHKCLPSIKIYIKFLLGMMLQVARVITLTVCDIKAREDYHDQNTTIYYKGPGQMSSSAYRNWMAVSSTFHVVSFAILSVSSIEFLASQTPYSMRGLMIGAASGSVFIFTMIEYGIYWPFTQQSLTWDVGIISHEGWYLLLVLFILILFSGLLLAVGRWYKNRKREDVLPNEHIFAERYYSQLH